MKENAKQLIPFLDITCLSKDQSLEKIEKLSINAVTPFGKVAGLCVYPEYINATRDALNDQTGSSVRVISVVNFPKGDQPIAMIAEETAKVLQSNIDEVEMVIPLEEMLNKQYNQAQQMVLSITKMIHEAGKKAVLIIETATLEEEEDLIEALKIATLAQVDFIKTATGKLVSSANTELVEFLCQQLVDLGNKSTGIKIVGGVSQIDEAIEYLEIIKNHYGEDFITTEHVRFVSSSLLTDLMDALGCKSDLN